MKKLLFVLFTLPCLGQAPAVEWTKIIGGINYDDLGSIIQTTHDNGYIMVGATSSTDGDISGNHGGNDVLVVKLNALGGILWIKTFGGSGSDSGKSIYETADGGYILCGSTASTNNDVTFNHGFYDAWVIKLNTNGDLEWQKTYGGTAQDDSYCIRPTSDGGYIIGGISRSTNGDVTGNNGESDYWVIKTDSSGDIQWQKNYGGSSLDVLSSVEPTSDGGYIVSGNVFSTNGDVLGNHGGTDYWILKTNSIGIIEWQKTLGGSSYEFSGNIHQTSDGGYIVTGTTPSVDGDITVTIGLGDFWIVKLNAAGTIEWQKSYGGTAEDNSYFIQQTVEGGYVIAGISKSQDVDLLNNHGLADFWILKIDINGNTQWQKNIGGSNNDYASYIQQTESNGFIIGGRTYSNDFDVVPNYHGNSDIFILKLAPDTLENNVFIKNSLSIFPNPTTTQLHLQSANNLTIDKVIITDMMGKTIFQQTENTTTINTQNLANGLYILQVFSQGNKYQHKFIKE
ncbi:T9SS type A sorting domain-containing protein [Flavobacterium sp. XGLA_31]|uniref:T9SS type A sorting domain-containing protein n=1 Tax=Flavobacterium sp. XGLA_31 TaxID=3447666 RepID=UPI003F386E0F